MLASKFLNPRNDVAFRKIFGTERNKDILIHFINDILGLDNKDKIHEVTFLTPVQNPDIASKKESIVDVLCRAESGEQIIVEMQVSPQRGFEKRAQYYAAKAYSRQLNRGQEEDGQYHRLKEIIFIAISNYEMFPDKKNVYKSDHVILDKKSLEHDLKDFYFTFIELPKFKKDKIEDLENIVEKWCYFFKNADSTSEADLKRIIGSDEVIERAYEELNQFNWSEDELLAYEQEKKRDMDARAIEGYKEDQYKKREAESTKKALETGLKKGIEQGIEKGIEQGIEKGIEQGIEKGIEQGIEKGIEKGLTKVAINLLKQGQSIDFISQVTGLSEEEIEKLSK